MTTATIPEASAYWSRWQAGNDGTGKRMWFAFRHSTREYARDRAGQIRRFGSREAAQKVADENNRYA